MTTQAPAAERVEKLADWAQQQGATVTGATVVPAELPHVDLPHAEANIFAMSKTGFKVHIKLPSQSATIVKNLTVLLEALAVTGFTPDTSFGFKGSPSQNAQPAPVQAAQPSPSQPAATGPSGVAEWIYNADGSRNCSVHGPAKWVPPGTSRAGKPYTGFWACQVRGCKPVGEG